MADNGIGSKNSELASCDVWVLGGGISGLTTALVLQSLGLKVAILTEYVPLQLEAGSGRPLVATDYAMASAYPHNLQVANLSRISNASQEVFSHLSQRRNSGVELYSMYEVFEQQPEQAPLGAQRLRFRGFEGTPDRLIRTINPPARPGAAYLWGWTFDTYFADMPRYLPFLWSLFRETTGCTYVGRLSLAEVVEHSADRVLINCLGWGAIDMFGDRLSAVIMRGRQVLVPGAARLTGPSKHPVAYNYTPLPEIYQRADGTPEYVHFFPRSDGWILGQTREPGSVDDQGQWSGAAVCATERLIGQQAIPSPIIDLNHALLKNWLGCDLGARTLVGREGLRYYRDPSGSGVRLQAETLAGNLVLHNYGHGGSGVTMSWGCALEAARLLLQSTDLIQPGNYIGGEFDHLIRHLLWNA